MKKLALLLIVPFLVFSSCKNDSTDPGTDPGTKSNYEVLTNYLVDQNLDLPVVLTDWIIPAPALADVDAYISQYDFIDVREPDDFATGHIEGAINTPLADVLTTAANTTKPIIVVCYSGQKAAHAVVALRLSGYSDAKVLLWGMSGWNTAFSGPWVDNIGDVGGFDHANWSANSTSPIPEFVDPTLTTSGTDGSSILKDRVQTMLNGGFKGIQNTLVLDNPEQYYINVFWDQNNVDDYGCIKSAFRIKPLSIANGDFKNYDPNKTSVTYCWTGQTSSMVTAYLNVIGYNAVSLKYGSNGMIYTELTEHKFKLSNVVDLPVITE